MSVYALKDPRDGRARYVGRSPNPRGRYRSHIIKAHSQRIRDWVSELRALGLIPELALLEGGTEHEWIVRLQPDLNVAPGRKDDGPRHALTRQIPPVRVSAHELAAVQERAERCGLRLTEYIRYRILGKRVLTGRQLDRVKQHETPVD